MYPFLDLTSIKVVYWECELLSFVCIIEGVSYFAVCIVILERDKQMARQRFACEYTVGLGNVPAQKNNKQCLW